MILLGIASTNSGVFVGPAACFAPDQLYKFVVFCSILFGVVSTDSNIVVVVCFFFQAFPRVIFYVNYFFVLPWRNQLFLNIFLYVGPAGCFPQDQLYNFKVFCSLLLGVVSTDSGVFVGPAARFAAAQLYKFEGFCRGCCLYGSPSSLQIHVFL